MTSQSCAKKFSFTSDLTLSFQVKLREEKEAKRATMDGRHEYILTTVSERLGMSVDDTEDFILEEDQVCTERVGVWPISLNSYGI